MIRLTCLLAAAATAFADVNVGDFGDRVVDGDWAPAIQAAIDSIGPENGTPRGVTVLFPPGEYRVDQPIVLGKKESHYGTRLSGYGATLVGSETLDAWAIDAQYEARRQGFEANDEKTWLMALPGELDNDGKNVGPPILELWNPPGEEGAMFVIEGLTFKRAARWVGVAIKIPAETAPKNVLFRDIQVFGQNVGIHVNFSYQVRFDNCLIRGNRIGIWGRNHFNGVNLVNCSIRRNQDHGLMIGPNAGQWGSSAIHVAGCIFESNKGYGILNAGGNQVTIVGNYFEANGNDVGVIGAFGHTTIDTNHFWGFYGHGHQRNRMGDRVISDTAHIVGLGNNIIARGNNYHLGAAILLFGLRGNDNVFDALPTVAEGVDLPDGATVAAANGLGAYVYEAATRTFTLRRFALEPTP